MEPFAYSAVAVQWEFRCHGAKSPDRPWEWRCRSGDGTIVATSARGFRSLREAVADAGVNGFRNASLSRAG